MAAYSGTYNFYNSFKEYMADGTIDISAVTANRFMVALHTNTYVPNAATDTVYADATNEISNTGGYTKQDIANITWTESPAGTMIWNGDDVQWTASGDNFDAARYWVLYDDESAGATDALIAYGYIDDSPADVQVTDGTTLTLQWNAGGLFTLT